MSARANKPVSVTLGALGGRAQARVETGDYASLSEVVRAGLRALDREETMFDAMLKARVADALADPGPDIPAADVAAGLRARHAARRGRGA